MHESSNLSIDKLYLNGNAQRYLYAIMEDSDYLQNIDKQAKVYELGKHIDRPVYKLYGLTEEDVAIVEGK